MTTIEDKLEAYLRRDRLEYQELDVAEARARGIRCHRSFFGRTWTEVDGVVTSSLLFKSFPAFIGVHSYMNEGGYVKGAAFIGRYCSIGRRVSLGASMHSSSGLSTSPATRSERPPQAAYSESEQWQLFGRLLQSPQTHTTVIENDVWIGDGAVVLEGVRLGTGCIVGANAVVHRDVAPYSVVAGLPARPIRQRFPQEVVDRLLASKWWNLPPAHVRSLPTAHILATLERLEREARAPREFETFMVREPTPPSA